MRHHVHLRMVYEHARTTKEYHDDEQREKYAFNEEPRFNHVMVIRLVYFVSGVRTNSKPRNLK